MTSLEKELLAALEGLSPMWDNDSPLLRVYAQEIKTARSVITKARSQWESETNAEFAARDEADWQSEARAKAGEMEADWIEQCRVARAPKDAEWQIIVRARAEKMETLAADEARSKGVALISGNTVTIFNDPITKEKPEGEAILLKNVWVDGPMQRWKVRFKADGFVIERNIYNDEARKAGVK